MKQRNQTRQPEYYSAQGLVRGIYSNREILLLFIFQDENNSSMRAPTNQPHHDSRTRMAFFNIQS